MPRPPKVLRLDEIEQIPGPGTLSWLPVRHRLGVRAFGCNAYTAAEAGRDVVEPHTEDPRLAHEELYFVARGRAEFTIDGRTYDAPAGTYVFVPDPASHRRAVASEPGTTVLSFGGPPTFEPSAWEWSFRAAPLERADRARAREILEDGLRAHPDSPGLNFNLARIEALDGHSEEALARLQRAIELRPEVREWASRDEDLAPLRGHPGFQSLMR
jgi:tetratricopeptide (TPR) repeat protein